MDVDPSQFTPRGFTQTNTTSPSGTVQINMIYRGDERDAVVEVKSLLSTTVCLVSSHDDLCRHSCDIHQGYIMKLYISICI